jgi:hypothetical protein
LLPETCDHNESSRPCCPRRFTRDFPSAASTDEISSHIGSSKKPKGLLFAGIGFEPMTFRL